MRFLIMLIVAALVLAGGYLYLTTSSSTREDVAAVPVSEEAAASAQAKLDRLQLDLEEVWLTDSELTSLFMLHPEVWELGGVSSPVVRMRGDTMSLSGTMDTDALPDLTGIDEIRRILPDTVRVYLSGTVGEFSGADAIINVTKAEVASLPIPARFVPDLAEHFGLPGREGLPETALILPLPRGVGAARVSDGELVLSP